jgi:hypothetical protein
MKQYNNSNDQFSVKEQIGLGVATFFPILFLTELTGAIIMVIKRVSERKNRLINKRKEHLLTHSNKYTTIIDRKIRKKPNNIIEWEPVTPKPKKNILKFILKQWQFWLIITIFALSIIFAIINSSNTVNQPQQNMQQTTQQPLQPEDVRQQIENNLSLEQTLTQQLVNGSTTFMVFIMIIGIIIGVYSFYHIFVNR